MVFATVSAQSIVEEMDAASRGPQEAFGYIALASVFAFVVVVLGVRAVAQEIHRRGGYGVSVGSVVAPAVVSGGALVGALVFGFRAFDRVDTGLSILDAALSLLFVVCLIVALGLGIFVSTKAVKALA
ncbi:MAG: hypothetical protein OJJ55_09335 [Rhodococcus sp.]|jgi:hypothetical protein|uniref:Integral membrane protein n=1 Tax=Rhodococcus qingshengii JCM 15477 TaxID=1303681 RepID=A0AB38RNT5_RHOSG|nr:MULTISPECIES: hypothetical protein [Rhodococcus]MCC4306092.1 hypothetical protein [Rhodococcus sp. 3-2]MCW0191495.1 hypothetical protein [Rhodococcus sp. (in: high G+C Gram-positive bacteria)]UPU46983.1 hypothetical protein M0639_34755 [Rhodococcus qingshengii JCM 15477]